MKTQYVIVDCTELSNPDSTPNVSLEKLFLILNISSIVYKLEIIIVPIIKFKNQINTYMQKAEHCAWNIYLLSNFNMLVIITQSI